MNYYNMVRQKKWEKLREARERCEKCMYDAPHGEPCCKLHCGEYTFCSECKAECRNTPKRCEK